MTDCMNTSIRIRPLTSPMTKMCLLNVQGGGSRFSIHISPLFCVCFPSFLVHISGLHYCFQDNVHDCPSPLVPTSPMLQLFNPENTRKCKS